MEVMLEAKDTNVKSRLQLTTTQKGVIWLDQVSAMPADTYKVWIPFNHCFLYPFSAFYTFCWSFSFATLLWYRVMVSALIFLKCFKQLNPDSSDFQVISSYFWWCWGEAEWWNFLLYHNRWMLCWRWMVEKCIPMERNCWTLGRETRTLWWCLDVLDWWWSWPFWIFSGTFLCSH